MCFQTAKKWFETGKQAEFGAPAGSNIINILNDLKKEDYDKYKILYDKVKGTADIMETHFFPLGSELYVDQTAHDQVYSILNHYGRKEKMLKVLHIIKALRAGAQPVWFWYGNEKRGNVTCWYAQTFNSKSLFSGFEITNDQEMLNWGYGGLSSFLTTILDNGGAQGWFLWWPDRMGFDSRSLDTDLGLYGFLLASKSYVVKDEDFGLVGYGCSFEEKENGEWLIVPADGLCKRLFLSPLNIDIDVEKGEISQLKANPESRSLRMELSDSTGYLSNVSFRVSGVDAQKSSLKNKEGQRLTVEDEQQIIIEANLNKKKRVIIELSL